MAGDSFVPRLVDTLLFGLQLFAELALLFVLISALVGALNAWLPPERIQHWLSARHGRGYLLGALIGSATPFCSCSTVPLTMGLLKGGAGFGPTMTLLFTSPLVNPVIVALFWLTFGLELTLLYAGMAIGAAVLVAWLMDRAGFERYLDQGLFAPRRGVAVGIPVVAPAPAPAGEGCGCSAGPTEASGCCDTPQVAIPRNGPTAAVASAGAAPAHRGRVMVLLQEAWDQFRTFLPHIAIGVAIGAVAHGFVPDAWLVRYAGPDNLLAIPLAALIGVPLYVRGSTMIPIAMTLTAKGMGIGAVIALVIGGAGASLPEVVMLKRMFRWPILAAFLLSVFGIAITTGYLAEWLF